MSSPDPPDEPSVKRPTLRDVAAETGLSVAAVSYALRGLQGKESTRERVLEAAARLGYQADPIARALASGTTGTVGVLCGSLGDLWQQRLAAALGRALFAEGVNGLIVDAAGDPEHQLAMAQRVVQQRVDALVVIPLDALTDDWEPIGASVPLVSVGDQLASARTVSAVLFDDSLAVTHSFDVLAGAGHRRIGVLTPEKTSRRRRPVEQTVADQARKRGLAVSLTPCPYELHDASEVVVGLLRAPQRPTALLGLADSMAYGALAAARHLGLTVPEDVSVVGFDDHPMSALLTPALSSYRWPLETITAAIMQRVRQASAGARRVDDVLLAPEPFVRGSVGPAPTT